MDIKILKSSIASSNIPQFLIFSGEEQALCKQYIKKISESLNKYFKYYNSADEVLVEIDTNMREDFLYIILNDENLIKKPAYIDALIKTGRNIIVYNTSYDSKCSLYKDYKDYCVIFKKLDKYSITLYLLKQLKKHDIEVSQDRIEKLVDICDCNLSYCLNELDKIITLDQRNSNVLFDFMLENNFPDYRKVNTFASLYKVLNKDKSFLDDYAKIGDLVISILSILYKQAQSKLDNSNNIRLADIIQICSMLDSGIKDGSISDKYAIDYLLLKVL